MMFPYHIPQDKLGSVATHAAKESTPQLEYILALIPTRIRIMADILMPFCTQQIKHKSGKCVSQDEVGQRH